MLFLHRQFHRGGDARFRQGKATPSAVSLLTVAALFSLVFFSATGEAAVEVPGRIVLELTEAGARALHAGTLEVPLPVGGEALRPWLEPLFVSRTGPLARYALLTFDAGAAASGENRRWIEALTGSPLVTRGQSDLMLETAALPNDPYLTGVGGVPPQKHLYNPGGLSLQASRAWPFVPADREVVVAIIDSGVDWRHPDLGGDDPPTTGVLWRNEAEIDGVAGLDDDLNGFTDDIVGWDFVDLPRDLPSQNAHPSEDKADEDNDPSDFAGHGTQVAGYVAALTDNGEGIAGAAPGARIMSLRAGWLTSTGSAVVYMTYTARAIEYAALNGAQVINCSWDSSSILGMEAAVDLAVDTYDVVIVASAGNQGSSVPTSPQYLAKRPDVLGVGGIQFTGLKASGSNYGDWVDIAGFYRETSTTWFDYSASLSTYYRNPLGGTSFAAPQIAGQAALLRLVRPEATAAEVRLWIQSTGQDLTLLDPTYGTQLGGGLADYAASAQAAGGGWDAGRGAKRLTGSQHSFWWGPFAPGTGSYLGFLGSEGLQVQEPADGSSAPGWGGGVPAGAGAGEFYPLSVPWERVGFDPDLLVWAEDGQLKAAFAPGDVPDGWPVALPDGYGQPAATVPDGGASATIYVPHGSGVLVVNHDETTGVKTSSLDLPVDRIAVGQLDDDLAWEVAGIDTSGVLRVHDPDDEGGAATWSVEVGEITAGPVMVELLGQGEGIVIVAASSVTSPDTQQELHKIGEAGLLHEMDTLTVPPVRHLSVGRYRFGAMLLAADEAGGIHTFDTNPASVDAGGPLAGEVIAVDLNNDFQTEVIALRTDGTLMAWSLGGGEFQMLSGFPRRFPNGAAEPPLILDQQTQPWDRFLIVADTTGAVWSLPLDIALKTLDTWPGALGGSLRNAYLSYERATPVGASAVLRESDGDLCWAGTGLDEYVSLRARDVEARTTLWEGAPRDAGCADLGDVGEGGRVALEGLDRRSGWEEIATLDIAVTPAFRLAAPHPNPFAASTRLEWAGSVGEVRVRVFDVAGRLRLDRRVNAGAGGFTWDGADDRGRRVPPGLYFLRATDGATTSARRVLRIP